MEFVAIHVHGAVPLAGQQQAHEGTDRMWIFVFPSKKSKKIKDLSQQQAKKHSEQQIFFFQKNGAKLDQSCRQRGWVSAYVSRHCRSVARGCTLSSTSGMSLTE